MNSYVHVLKSKIHRATVTEAELEYFGSITIDGELMKAAGIAQYEKVLITSMGTGNRFETYALKGPANSGVVCVNGPSAHLISPGDEILIMSFALIPQEELENVKPTVIFPHKNNSIKDILVLE